MHCPECDLVMDRRQIGDGLFWGCPRCGGCGFTVSVLRRNIDPKAVWQLWSQTAASPEDGKPCPICRKSCHRSELQTRRGMQELDVCRRCQFIWLDPGEYGLISEGRELPKKPVPPKQELPQAAREAIALAEVERIGRQAESEGPSDTWDYLPAVLGLPVECHSEPAARTPWITLVLVVVIVGLSVAGFANRSLIETFGLRPAEVWDRGGVPLLTSFFFHGGIWHLIGNMYFLWVFGDNVEDFLGVRRFLLLLTTATLAGGLTHLLANPDSMRICIGASGGISGVIAFYALRFPAARLGFLWYYHWVTLSARTAFCLWLILQTYVSWAQVKGFSNVSGLAHLGGALLGVLVWWRWSGAPDAPPDLKEAK